MTKDNVLDAISKELEFYRSRQLSVHYFSIVSILLAISGQQSISIHNQLIASFAYTSFFILVPIMNYLISRSYQERIHYLREIRADLFENEDYPNPFPKHNQFKMVSPNILYVVIVSSIALLATLVVWFGN